jgi:hypothetical protein
MTCDDQASEADNSFQARMGFQQQGQYNHQQDPFLLKKNGGARRLSETLGTMQSEEEH